MTFRLQSEDVFPPAGWVMPNSRPIRIVYVIGTLDRGGSERQLVELVTRLDRRQFEPHVCCLSAGGALEKELESAGVPVTIFGFRGFTIFRHLWKVCREIWRMVAYLRRVRPVIVHGYLFWAYVLGTWAARLARVPIVVSSRRSLGQFKAGKTHYLAMERLANALTDVWIANAEAVRADAIRQEKLLPDRIVVIPNGVSPFDNGLPMDRQEIKDRLGIPTQARVILTVSNLISYKGHEVLLEAASRVIRDLPDALFLWAGDGLIRPELELKIQRIGLTGAIRVLGVRADVADLLRISELYVHPSYQEGCPNAILEALAAAVPVVATEVGGVPEIVIHEHTGLLVRAGDPDRLATAILQMLSDPRQARTMAEKGKADVLVRFSVEGMVRATETLYSKLLAGEMR